MYVKANPISLRETKATDIIFVQAEETIDASRIIPIAITWSVFYNIMTLFVIGTAMIFCLGDVDSLLTSRTGQPFIQLFYNATQSHAGTSVMAAILITLVECCVINEVATSSRQLWCVPMLRTRLE